MARKITCGLIQASNPLFTIDDLPEKIKSDAIEKHLSLIEQAAAKGVRILCLQELFYGPYFPAEQNPKWYELTERVPDGPTIKVMREMARKHRMAMVVPVYEVEMTGVYFNTAAV